MNYKERTNLLTSKLKESIYKEDKKIIEIIHKLEYKKSETALNNFIKKELVKCRNKEISLLNSFIVNLFEKYT